MSDFSPSLVSSSRGISPVHMYSVVFAPTAPPKQAVTIARNTCPGCGTLCCVASRSYHGLIAIVDYSREVLPKALLSTVDVERSNSSGGRWASKLRTSCVLHPQRRRRRWVKGIVVYQNLKMDLGGWDVRRERTVSLARRRWQVSPPCPWPTKRPLRPPWMPLRPLGPRRPSPRGALNHIWAYLGAFASRRTMHGLCAFNGASPLPCPSCSSSSSLGPTSTCPPLKLLTRQAFISFLNNGMHTDLRKTLLTSG